MKLLQSLSHVAVPLRASIQVLFTAVVAAAMVGLEVAGRSAKSDAQDSVYALLLLALIGVVAMWHRRRPLGWVDWLAARWRVAVRWLKGWKYEHGIDFRGTPLLPHKLPAGLWVLTAALVGWAAAGVLVWEWVPGGWRAVGLNTSYLLYLSVTLVVWVALLVGLLAGLFLPMTALDRRLQHSFGDHDRRVLLFFASLVYLFVLASAAAFVPVLAAVVVCAVAAGVAIGWAAQADRGTVAVLWRRPGGQTVFAVPAHRVIGGGTAVLVLALVAVVLNARGGRLLTPLEATDPMPLTASLAALVVWTVPGLLALFLVRVRERQRTDPANRTPMAVHLVNRLSPEAGERAARVLAEVGWAVRTGPDREDADDVCVELVHPELSEATEFDPQWPLKVTPGELADPRVRDRLSRRDEIHLRRRIFRGLNSLIKRGIAARKEKGGGFWLAPHWWFIDGLGREDGGRTRRTEDGETELLRRIGPPFDEVFGERPRQHLHRVLRAVQVDLIYIEDGVPPKALTKVLRTVFEVYDVHDGRKAVDDHCFHGIPKVRVMVHEFSPDKPPAAVTGPYRQPKFDDLSRCRVLHVFRDKGDHEELIDAPRDFDYVPSPVLVG